MLTNRNTRIFFLILFAVLLFFRQQIPWQVYILLLLLFLAITAYGSYFIGANYYLKSLLQGDKNKKAIAITFDDGPMPGFTPKVLDILKEQQVPASFFVIGRNIAGNEGLLKRIDAEGHLIGNHSYSHNYWFSLKSKAEMVNDLRQCDNAICDVVGKRPALFRPPYGVTNPMVASAVQEGKYTSIGWSLRTYDTNATNAQQLLNKTLNKLKNGDVVLFHDWGAHTIGILSAFIKAARAKGFEFERVDVLLGVKAYY